MGHTLGLYHAASVLVDNIKNGYSLPNNCEQAGGWQAGCAVRLVR